MYTFGLQAYDPEGKGFVEPDILRNVFDNLGFGHISDEDLRVLVEAADGDGDGRVTLEDFRAMCAPMESEDNATQTDAKEGKIIDQSQANR